MNESIPAEDKKQNRQKPPRNLGRIACEILAGTATGLAVALPVAYVIGSADRFQGCFGPLGALVVLFYVFPIVHGLGSAVGVYLVGSRSKQTGSFLVTLGWGCLAGILTIVILYILLRLQTILTITWSSSVLIVGLMVEAQKIVQWARWALLFLVPPIVVTLGFNLTRRYKEPPSS